MCRWVIVCMARDSDSGLYTNEYSDEAFIAALRGRQRTTMEVADEVGCSHKTAHQRLTELENDGPATARDVGRTKLWSLSEETDR